jgi:hypothetical protein
MGASQKKQPKQLRQLDVDMSLWPTRNTAADQLACSPSTLLNYERRGMLHKHTASRVDNRGSQQAVVVYDPEEIKQLAIRLKRGSARGSAREPGEVAAQACELFSEGLTDVEVIIKLRETFEAVDEFRQKWIDHGGSKLVISPIAKEALEAIVGPFTNVAELVDLVREKTAGGQPEAVDDTK